MVHPVADPARVVVEQIGRDDLEVVVRGVGERAAAVAVTHRPDVLDVGPALVVDDDVAARVGLHARVLQAQIVGVGPSSDRHQQVRTGDGVSAVARCHLETVVALGETNGVGIELDRRCPRSPGSL